MPGLGWCRVLCSCFARGFGGGGELLTCCAVLCRAPAFLTPWSFIISSASLPFFLVFITSIGCGNLQLR